MARKYKPRTWMRHPQGPAWNKPWSTSGGKPVSGRPVVNPGPLPETKITLATIEHWRKAKNNNLRVRDASGALVDTMSRCPPVIAAIIRHQDMSVYWTDVTEYRCIVLVQDKLRTVYMFHGGGKFWFLEQFYQGLQQFRSTIYTDRARAMQDYHSNRLLVAEIINLGGE